MRDSRPAPVVVAFLALVITLGCASTCLSQAARYDREFFALDDSRQAVESNSRLFSGRLDAELGALNVRAFRDSGQTLFPLEVTDMNTPAERPGEITSTLLSARSQGGDAWFEIMGAAMFVSAASDLVSTELFLSRPGIVEYNPVQRERGVRIASHVAVPAFVYWATERLHRNGKDKWALLVRIGFNIAYSYAAMHNTRLYLR